MRIYYKQEKEICKFGNRYIKKFVQKHKSLTQLNETQLNLLVETIVYFIDTLTEAFMEHGYPGDPIWILQQLKNINTHSVKHGCVFGRQKEAFKLLAKPLENYLSLILDTSSNPIWIINIEEIIYLPLRLCFSQFDELCLGKLQTNFFGVKQIKESQVIFDILFTQAIDSIQQSDAYKKAKIENHLYYLGDNMPILTTEKRIDDKTKNQQSSTSATSTSSAFFRNTGNLSGENRSQSAMQPTAKDEKSKGAKKRKYTQQSLKPSKQLRINF